MLTLASAPMQDIGLTGLLDSLRSHLEQRPFTWPLPTDRVESAYTLRIANDQPSRDRAYRLAYEIYSSHGYARPGLRRLVWPYDAERTTLTLLIEDAEGSAVATATLAYGAASPLPSDGLFPREMAALRAGGRRLVEVCRLAVAAEHRGQPVILQRLINVLYIHAARIGKADDAVIEVHPCRARWYQRNLLFEQIGESRPCPNVGGQPTVLLRCDIAHYEHRRLATADVLENASMFGDFYGWLEEGLIAEALSSHACPMSADEAAAFGLPVPAPAAIGPA